MPLNIDPEAFDAVFFLLMADLVIPITLQEIAHLGIADLLSDGPKSVSVLAQEVGVQADVLQLSLRLLSSKDVFVETQAGIFAHTENHLRSLLLPSRQASSSDSSFLAAASVPSKSFDTCWITLDLHL